MSDDIVKIVIKKENVSDDVYAIHRHYSNGDMVHAGSVLATYETSKSVVDLEAPSDGVVYYNDFEQEEVRPGFILAVISKSGRLVADAFDAGDGRQADNHMPDDIPFGKGPRISRKAQELMTAHGLDAEIFAGRAIVRENDVQDYLAKVASTHGNSCIAGSTNAVIVVGGGGHAKMCIDVIQQSKQFTIRGIVDPNLTVGMMVCGVPVLGGEDLLEGLLAKGDLFAVVGIGAWSNCVAREKLYQKLRGIGFLVPNIIHKSAIIEPSVTMGAGNQFMAGAIIGSDAFIGDNCIFNSGCIVSHDAMISDNVHIAPGAIIAGKVTVGANTVIGMGVTVYEKISIGSNVIIPNGVNIFDHVPNNAIIKR